jgi:hypothetical protein
VPSGLYSPAVASLGAAHEAAFASSPSVTIPSRKGPDRTGRPGGQQRLERDRDHCARARTRISSCERDSLILSLLPNVGFPARLFSNIRDRFLFQPSLLPTRASCSSPLASSALLRADLRLTVSGLEPFASSPRPFASIENAVVAVSQ